MKHSAKYILSIIMLLLFSPLQAQQPLVKEDIRPKTGKSPHPGRVVLKEIENLRDDTVLITIINEYEKESKQKAYKTLMPRQKFKCDVTFNVIMASLKNSKPIEIYRSSSAPDKKKVVDKRGTESGQDDVKSDNVADVKRTTPEISSENAIEKFRAHLNSIQFLSDSIAISDSLVISGHIATLNLSSIVDKSAYIDERVEDYVKAYNDSLDKYAKDSLLIVNKYLADLGEVADKDSCKKSMLACYREKIARKAAAIEPLEKIINENRSSTNAGIDLKLIIVGGCVLFLCVVLVVWYWRVNKKSSRKQKEEGASISVGDNVPALVVVGAKSTTALKKQCLDDVYENEAFLKIDASDFCDNSLVRTMYIKNSCIKDIYNMYAEDLRNPDNPKEDGCMVLGRWVYDEKDEKYDISLEEIVLPGDDAVFAEYELNFGGKIKLRMSEKLRKLRKDTGLQYDLTCWVHSHPGLGVFFSSSDNNVHHQLKHPIYPGFLTAMVIDILTPQQELGIFTFRDPETVNSKGDLKRMYSLEELYNSALQSERRSFDSSNYFDILGKTRQHLDSCYGIQLNNSAIIDMTFLTSKPNGYIGFAHGYMLRKGERTQCVVSAVNDSKSSPNTDKLGCFVMASHCSIPSIRKAVSCYLHEVHFVLVYTASNGLLTAIPVVDKDLSSSDIYYGEQELENLKIWTRRRR